MINTTKVVSGNRCFDYDVIDEAIRYLEGQKKNNYINDDMAIIIQIVGGDK